MLRLLPAIALLVFAPGLVREADAHGDDATAVERNGGRWVVHAGAGSVHAWNVAGVTREFTDGRLRPFLTAGLGTILVGAGAAYYTNPHGSGLVFSATGGLAGAHATAAFDIRLRQRVHLVLGGSYGTYFLQYRGPLPVAALSISF